jgi:hypothetical protein
MYECAGGAARRALQFVARGSNSPRKIASIRAPFAGQPRVEHGRPKVVDIDRLLEQGHDAKPLGHRKDRLVIERRHQDYGHVPLGAAERGEDSKPRQIGHQDVGDDYHWTSAWVVQHLSEAIEELRSIAGFDHMVAVDAERIRDDRPHVLIVFRDQNAEGRLSWAIDHSKDAARRAPTALRGRSEGARAQGSDHLSGLPQGNTRRRV